MSERQMRKVALLVAACLFMELLDGTIVLSALPRIGAALDCSPSATGVVITAYLVTVAVLIPLSSWMTLRYGYRRVFLLAIALFTLASLGCAASHGLEELVTMRVLQGAGGAMMVPVGRMIVFERAAKSQLMRLMSYIVWPALVAPVLAPPLGGAIVTYASWRWLFLINVPLGIAGIALAWRLVEGRPVAHPPQLDRLGVLLSCGGLSGLTYAAHRGADPHPPWTLVALLAGTSAVVLAAAVRHLLRTREPLVDLRTLVIPTFARSIAGSGLTWLVTGGIPFLLALLFQTVFGWSPLKAGALLLFVFAGNVGAKPATTFLYRTYGFRTVLVASSSCLSLSALGLAFVGRSTPLALIALVAVVSGAARSVTMTGYTTLTLSDVPPQQMRPANTLVGTAQQLFNGLAIALATVALRAGDAVGPLLPGGDERNSYAVAFAVLTCVAILATTLASRLPSDAGRALTAAALRGGSAASPPRR